MSESLPDNSSSLRDKCFKDLLKSNSIRNGYYTSDEHNLIPDFYEPILKNAKTYDRTTGAFSSRWFFILSYSLIPFIRNAIKNKTPLPIMRLVSSHNIRTDDYEQYLDGYKNLYTENKLVEMLEKLAESPNEVLLRAVRRIATMVKYGFLEIKVGFPHGKLKTGELFHQKMGIFTDLKNDCIISFEGGNNASEKGDSSSYGVEGFTAHISDYLIEEYQKPQQGRFNKLWNNESSNITIRPLNKVPKEHLSEFASKDNLEKWLEEEELYEKRRSLHQCQKDAIDAWNKNGGKGIFDMCTGSGKSRAALSAIESLNKHLVTIIISGTYQDLMTQWKDKEINPFFGEKNVDVTKISSYEYSNRAERESVLRKTIRARDELIKKNKRVFILTIMQTAKDLWFLDTIKKTGIPPEELAIIIDEVHHAGSKTGRGVLEIDAKYRIGLSATWKRPNPTENKRTLEYFKGNNNSVVHSYSLKDGIKDGLLSPYEYHIHPRYLSGELQDEFRENLKKYNNEVKKISVRLSFSDDDMLEKTSQGSSSELFKLKNAWKNTVNKAFARISEIMKIVETEQKNLKKCVIYCASKDQSDRITRELRGHKGLRDTFPYDSRTESDVRIKARKRFEDTYRGEPRFIVGIHCLDEGIDMPALDSGIFANSSKTKREWIQRRGRILRKHKDKEVSIIHDIIILPDKRAKLTEGEREYIDDEIERLSNFAEDAINSKDTIQEIRSLRRI